MFFVVQEWQQWLRCWQAWLLASQALGSSQVSSSGTGTESLFAFIMLIWCMHLHFHEHNNKNAGTGESFKSMKRDKVCEKREHVKIL